MKKLIASLILIASSNVYSQNFDDPERIFNMQNLMANKVEVSVVTTDNVTAICEKESLRRGAGGFGYRLEACSFWDKRPNNSFACTIVVGKRTSMHTLGHEFLHCIKGNWHNEPN